MAVLQLSCSGLTVKDEIAIGNEGRLGAVEFHTLVPGSVQLSYSQWQKILLTEPLICMSTAAYGDMKQFYEDACSLCNCCTYDTTAAVNTFWSKVQAVRIKK